MAWGGIPIGILFYVFSLREGLWNDLACRRDLNSIAEVPLREQITPYLLAIQQNPRIQTVLFQFLQLPGDSTASFLDAAASITTLKIWNFDMKAPGGVVAVAAALQRNKNIRRLELSGLDDEYLIPIVSHLSSNTCLK
jgi:hypothetical protein